jgi:hypothetical protein
VIGRNVQHVVSGEEAEESGELVRTVYKWPNRFNVDEVKANPANPDSDSPFIEPLQMALPKSARVRQ